jgi:hypothetical protein
MDASPAVVDGHDHEYAERGGARMTGIIGRTRGGGAAGRGASPGHRESSVLEALDIAPLEASTVERVVRQEPEVDLVALARVDDVDHAVGGMAVAGGSREDVRRGRPEPYGEVPRWA